jgi:tetratricopeptide (TPR) repeat protein
MIFCNKCGNEIPNEATFCTECGAAVPTAPKFDSPPTMRVNAGYGGFAAAPAREVTLPNIAPSLHSEAALSAPSVPPAGAKVKPVMIVIGALALAGIVAAILLTSSSSKSANSTITNGTTSSPSGLADSLQNAIDKGRLVNLTNDDAYTYYFQLRQSDPQNPKLTSVKSQVLPQLRSLGDNALRQATSIQWKRLTETDWAVTQRVYEWAHQLDPSDRNLEARWKYAEAEDARLRDDRYNSEQDYLAAIQLNPSWALPQFGLGLLHMRLDRAGMDDRSAPIRGQEARPYFQRAIELEPNWELPYLSLGTAYFLQKDLDTAEQYFRKATEMNPNWSGPHAWMASVYEKRNGMCHEAINEYERAISLVANDGSFDPAKTQMTVEKIRAKCP